MRMQKEEKIVVVLLLMALGSLAVAFWAFGPEEVSERVLLILCPKRTPRFPWKDWFWR